MGDFLRLLIDSIEYLWPFQVVEPWECGVYLVCGRVWRDVGPGLYVRVPFFTKILVANTVSEAKLTEPHTVNIGNGDSVTFALKFDVRVTDVRPAVIGVIDYEPKAVIDTVGVASEILAALSKLPTTKFRREQLRTHIETAATAHTASYGVAIEALTFPVFVRNMRTYRLFGIPGR